MFRRKKRILKDLETSFGQPKTEGFQFDYIKRYYSNKNNSSSFQNLSDQTCKDLDFDLFFKQMDRTKSKVGQQYLYNQLRNINFNSDQFKVQETILEYFKERPKERMNVEYQLNKLNNQQVYYLVDLFQQEIQTKPKWYLLFPLLSGTVVMSLLLSFFNPTLIFLLLAIIPINVLIHYGLKRRTYLFLNAVPSLLVLGSVAHQLYKFAVLKTNFPENQKSIQTIQSIKRKMSFFKLEQKVDSDMEAIYWFIIEFVKITFLLEPLLLFSSLDKLRNQSNDIANVFEFVGKTDAIISIASLRKGLNNYCVPEISLNPNHLHFKELQHPLIYNSTTNSVDATKSILLTGSNMSGKSTFIRAIGLNIISGLTINTCFATSAHIPFAKLHTVIRIEDNLEQSSSYFFKEVDEMKRILDESEQPTNSIILLDELFKGTNTIERIAAAKAVLSHLVKHGSLVFVSTHDFELTQLLKDKFELFHFSESFLESTIHFDYKLKHGVPSTGNAIRILAMLEFPGEIIAEATALVNAQNHTSIRNK